MKLYEPFNNTLKSKIGNFYSDNKGKIKDVIYGTLILGALGLVVTYSTINNNKKVENGMKFLEQIFIDEQNVPKSAIPQEETERLEDKFNRIKHNQK